MTNEQKLNKHEILKLVTHSTENILQGIRVLDAENTRLKEALIRIANTSLPHEEPVSRAIAFDALKGKE